MADEKRTTLKFKALVAAQVTATIEGEMEVDENGYVKSLTMKPERGVVRVQHGTVYSGPELAEGCDTEPMTRAATITALQNAMYRLEKEAKSDGSSLSKELLLDSTPAKKSEEIN